MMYSTSIGLDVHARSISAAAFVFETGEVVQRTFAYDPAAVAEWARALPQPAGCLYESGPTGFDLKRRLAELGLPCHVGAVTKMVRPSGDRVKTDRRDARFLARLLAVGEFVECEPPTPANEAARDLSRAREDAREALMNSNSGCHEQAAQRNSRLPATRENDQWPYLGHSNPPGHLSEIMWASQASSVPNLSASAAMLGASIPSPEFYAAVLAFEPSIAASPSARLRDAIVAPGSDRIFSS